jgi:hypothetical protein
MAGYQAPPINTLTLDVLNTEECPICFESLYRFQGNGDPMEITRCHHRFHQNCLNDNCTIQPNTLVNCSCPTCRQMFNYNTELENLEQQVQNRIDELTAPPVVEQPVVEQPVVEPAANPLNNLNHYTEANFAFDAIKKRYLDCVSQIIDDAWNNWINYNRYPIDQDNPLQLSYINIKVEYIHNHNDFLNKLIDNYKFNRTYRELLVDGLVFLNTINERLQNQEFIQTLKTLQGHLAEIGYGECNSRRFISKQCVINLLYAFLLQCYTGQNTRIFAHPPVPRNEELCNHVGITPTDNRLRNDNRFRYHLLENFIKNMLYSYTYYYIGSIPKNIYNEHDTVVYPFINILPMPESRMFPYCNPDLQFFQRYFQCYLNALTALSQINYEELFQQQGGKRTKSIRKTKRRRIYKQKSKSSRRK